MFIFKCFNFATGGFYVNEEAIVSNSFALDLQSDSNIMFAIEAYQTPIHSSIFTKNLKCLFCSHK